MRMKGWENMKTACRQKRIQRKQKCKNISTP